MDDYDYPHSDELRAYEDSVRGFLSMWNMGTEEQREWHLQQARQAQEWKGVFAREWEHLEERLLLLFEAPTFERYGTDDTNEERHTKDGVECSQLQRLHEGQGLGRQDVQAIRRCRESRDISEILAHVETQLLAKTWRALAVASERALVRGEPHHGDAQWAAYETVIKDYMAEWKQRIAGIHTRNAG